MVELWGAADAGAAADELMPSELYHQGGMMIEALHKALYRTPIYSAPIYRASICRVLHLGPPMYRAHIYAAMPPAPCV